MARSVRDARLVLASASPRRAALLAQVGISFEVEPGHATDETVLPGESPVKAAERLAREKATACRVHRPDADVVIAADTMVVLDGEILGKPANATEAYSMLRRLSGRAHEVITGYAVVGRVDMVSGAEITQVWFRKLLDREIERYLTTGEPFDKAGAYGIQGRAALFVKAIAGDYFTVVGLPLVRVGEALETLGFEIL